MARPLRLEFAHAFYHVTSRGNRQEDTYHDDADRQAWLSVLAQVCKRFNWTVHAYCLMSNHYHLLVETPEPNLSAGMRQLNGVYTQLTNRAHGRGGHVFQGRFKAIVVDKDNYLLELARYVVLNPVRAGMVQDAGQWPWSSYSAMLAPGWLPGADWLATDKLLAYFAPDQQSPDRRTDRRTDRLSDRLSDREEAQQRYAGYIREGIGLPSVWADVSGQVYLGGEKFVNKMRAMADQAMQGAGAGRSRLEIPYAQRRPVPLPLQAYVEQHPNNRNAAIQAAFATGSYTMGQLAEYFGLHYTSVSRIVKLV